MMRDVDLVMPGELTYLINYRPISLLPLFGKQLQILIFSDHQNNRNTCHGVDKVLLKLI